MYLVRVGTDNLAHRAHAGGFEKFLHIMKSAAALVENPTPRGRRLASGEQQIFFAFKSRLGKGGGWLQDRKSVV